VDAILGQLEQVLAVERCSCVRGDFDRAQRLPVRRIEGCQPVAGREPHVVTVIRDSANAVCVWKGPVLSDDLGSGARHVSILLNRQGSGE